VKIERVERITSKSAGRPEIVYDASTGARESHAVPDPVIVEADSLTLADMPETVLDGRLGEICRRLLPMSPRSYAWTVLLAVAGTMAHQSSKLRSNLFVALVGPKGSGKSSTIENVIAVSGLSEESAELERSMCGSAEGLLKKVGDAGGCARLYCPDELAHLFLKTQIDRASFAPILQRCFYRTNFDLVIAKGQRFTFNASLGVVGGIVQEKFDECFGSATTAGLHDRFIFALCPHPFFFDFRPFEGNAECLPPAVQVSADPDVWELKSEWLRTISGMTGRVAENAIRVASICAGFDGRKVLRAGDLGPAVEFARYQIRVRELLQPNPGENPDARCAFAILRKIEQLAPDGAWIQKRAIARAIHAERFGPGVFMRAGSSLEFNGELETMRSKADRRQELWRRT
jgi:hypothetical protein